MNRRYVCLCIAVRKRRICSTVKVKHGEGGAGSKGPGLPLTERKDSVMFGNLMTSCPIGVRRSRLQHGLWSAVTMLLPERLPHGRAPAVSHFKPHAEHLPFAHIVSQVVAYTHEIAEAAKVVGSKVHRMVLLPHSPLSQCSINSRSIV